MSVTFCTSTINGLQQHVEERYGEEGGTITHVAMH